MRKILFILVLLIVVPTAYCNYGRVCLRKDTSKLISFQSGDALLGTLTKNAISAGYNLTEIEEKYVTKQEWKAIEDEWIIQPMLEEKRIREERLEEKSKKIKKELKKLGINWTDFYEILK